MISKAQEKREPASEAIKKEAVKCPVCGGWLSNAEIQNHMKLCGRYNG